MAKKRTSSIQAKRKAPPIEAVSRPFAVLAAQAKKGAATPAERPPANKPLKAALTVALAQHEGDDALAFEMHMRDVRPLGKGAARIPATARALDKTPKPRPTEDLDAPARAELAALVASGLRFEVIDDGVVLEGRRVDADPREVRRLRTLRYTVDGKLDLHGLSAAKAKEAVLAFVARRRREGDRAVLIVHGKGAHSSGGTAVLRGEIGAWLSQSSATKDVLAFASVLDEKEESGALFVLLAKR